MLVSVNKKDFKSPDWGFDNILSRIGELVKAFFLARTILLRHSQVRKVKAVLLEGREVFSRQFLKLILRLLPANSLLQRGLLLHLRLPAPLLCLLARFVWLYNFRHDNLWLFYEHRRALLALIRVI